MPLFEFVCPKCNVQSAKIMSFDSSQDPQFCECGAQLDQVISRPAGFKVGKYGKGNR